MKFIVSSTGLFSRLQAISRVINSKNSLPILDCFLLELTDGTLSITASDSETTLSTSIETNDYDADGRFAVNSKTILDALKEIPEQPLTFEVNENMEIIVKYQNGTAEPPSSLPICFASQKTQLGAFCVTGQRSVSQWKPPSGTHTQELRARQIAFC